MLVAMVTAAVTAGGPALADGVRHALFAHDADKVDGKHAVSVDASATDRRGKLVATHATTGRLPNNIIAKAPNAEKLDGLDSTAFLAAAGKAADADKLDGRNSTDFLLSVGKAADADNLDGLDSTQFAVLTNDRVANSDKLDFMDSEDFAPAEHFHDDRYFNQEQSNALYVGVNGKAADAGKLDGRPLTEVRTSQTVTTRTSETSIPLTTSTATILPIDVITPAAGRIEISGTVDVSSNKPDAAGSVYAIFNVQKNQSTPQLPYSARWFLAPAAPAGHWSTTLPVTETFTVPSAGAHYFFLVAQGGGTNASHVTLNAHYFPTN